MTLLIDEQHNLKLVFEERGRSIWLMHALEVCLLLILSIILCVRRFLIIWMVHLCLYTLSWKCLFSHKSVSCTWMSFSMHVVTEKEDWKPLVQIRWHKWPPFKTLTLHTSDFPATLLKENDRFNINLFLHEYLVRQVHCSED
jgi:hypothetical protein